MNNRAIHIAEKYGYPRFVCEQPPYNLLDRRIENEILPMCKEFDLGVVTWSPLAQGLLAGRYIDTPPFPAGNRGDIAPSIQRLADEAEESIEKLEAERDSYTARVPSYGALQVTDSWRARLNRSNGKGRQLSETDRNFMERRFGVDFSGVRIHTDSSAIQLNNALNAQAFTHGKNIYLGAGNYSPGTLSGKRLLAHELTHTIQQQNYFSSKNVVQRRVMVTPAGKAGEVLGYFNRMCPEGRFALAGNEITQNCPLQRSHSKSCACLCKTASDRARTYTITVTTFTNRPRYYSLYNCPGLKVRVPWPSIGPHTRGPDENPFIYIPASSGNAIEFGAFDQSGDPLSMANDKWRILAHELCGHGEQKQHANGPKGNRPGHDATIRTENEIAGEHGRPQRGYYMNPVTGLRTPRQGESFHYEIGDAYRTHDPHGYGRLVFKLVDGTHYEMIGCPTQVAASRTLDNFATNSSALNRGHREQLSELSQIILKLNSCYPSGRVEVTGHTDAPGEDEHNKRLGQRRADAVRFQLIRFCVPARLIGTHSEGERQLRIPTNNSELLNRRAEIIYLH